jgi:hypothetical protein
MRAPATVFFVQRTFTCGPSRREENYSSWRSSTMKSVLHTRSSNRRYFSANVRPSI